MSYADITRRQFRRELEEAWLDYTAIDADEEVFLLRALADKRAARQSLQDKLSLIFQSLDRLDQPAA